MKKAIALISAAALIFAAAGCANKRQSEPDETGTQEQSSFIKDSAVEESVTELSSQQEASSSERPTKRPTVTLYSTRATSPNHLTERPTTTQRTTIKINVPTREPTTRHTTVLKTTQARTTLSDIEIVETTAAVPDPSFDYGGTLSFTGEDGLTDSVKIVSHTCDLTERQTFAIMLTVEILEHSSERTTMNIAYNCYDKNGKQINEKTLYTVVPLATAGVTVKTVATATADTVRIEFLNY